MAQCGQTEQSNYNFFDILQYYFKNKFFFFFYIAKKMCLARYRMYVAWHPTWIVHDTPSVCCMTPRPYGAWRAPVWCMTPRLQYIVHYTPPSAWQPPVYKFRMVGIVSRLPHIPHIFINIFTKTDCLGIPVTDNWIPSVASSNLYWLTV